MKNFISRKEIYNLLWHFANLQLYINTDYKYTFQRLIQTRKKYIYIYLVKYFYYISTISMCAARRRLIK